jgi:hypothetical protein
MPYDESFGEEMTVGGCAHGNEHLHGDGVEAARRNSGREERRQATGDRFHGGAEAVMALDGTGGG